jgi:hypothetical protein
MFSVHTGSTAHDPSVTTLQRPPARWAVVAAWTVPLCVLPSSVWRLSLLADDTIGMDAEGWYLITLSVVSVALAALTPGLVHRWGERVPRWVPRIGGRPVPARAAVVPAVTGALLLVAICVYGALNMIFNLVGQGPVFIGPDESEATRPEPDGVVVLLYAPLLAWGPLVLAVAWDRWRRRA